MSRAFSDAFLVRLEEARPGIDEQVVIKHVDRAIWFRELIGAERGDPALLRPPPYATFGDNLRYAYYVGLKSLYSSRKTEVTVSRKYTAADYTILQVLVSRSDDPLGPPLREFQNEFEKHGLEWPVLNPANLKPTEYASFVDREICRACGH